MGWWVGFKTRPAGYSDGASGGARRLGRAAPQTEAQNEEQHPKDNRIRSDQPNDRKGTGPRENRHEHPKDHRKQTAQDQL